MDESGRIRLYGMSGSLISNLTQAMGISYEVVHSADGEYGVADPDPEKFTGMLRTVCGSPLSSHELVSLLVKSIGTFS